MKATLHLVGSTNNFLSMQRRTSHLRCLDPALVSLASEEFPEAGQELFGPQLLERMTKCADAQRTVRTILSRLKSGRKRSRPFEASSDSPSTKRRSEHGFRAPSSFFRGAGPARYGSSSRDASRPYNTQTSRSSFRHVHGEATRRGSTHASARARSTRGRNGKQQIV